MGAWRTCASVAVALAAALPAAAQNYTLKEAPQKGDCFQVQVDMTLAGEMHVAKGDKPASLKLTATARHAFAQRLLEVDGKGVPLRAACVYEAAEAAIQAGPSQSRRTLRPDRTLLVVERIKDQNEIYCPKGPLTREEMELTSEHFDTLSLPGLLPAKEVALKATWKVPVETVQALCHFEGLTAQDLSCTLDEVTGDLARISVKGTASGIDLGAMVKLSVEGACQFDLKAQRFVGVTWKQKDDRTQGPASPASITETTYTVRRTPIEQPASLSDVALVSVPQDGVPDEMLLLYCRDARGRFELLYEREWQLVSQTDERTVLRLLDRGDFVAQATITPWTKARPGEHLSPDELKRAVAAGWKQEQVIDEGVLSKADAGRWVYRVSAGGELEGGKVVQNFYLIATPAGEQILVAFTAAQAQAQNLGQRDLNLISTLQVPAK